MSFPRPLPALILAVGLVGQTPTPPSSLEAGYTKQEAMVTMRDGVKLFTSIYLPKDTRTPHPILLTRTPYGAGPYGSAVFRQELGPSPAFAKGNYIVVYQDVRGRFQSEGQFVDARPVMPSKGPGDADESTDTYDTIDWLLKALPNHNGRVGMWGISYPGHYAVQGMLCGHPALKAVSPQAPMIDLWEGDDTYHRGAFQLAANFGFFLYFRSQRDKPSGERPPFTHPGTSDGYRWFLEAGPVSGMAAKLKQPPEPIWLEYLRHTTYDGYWQARNLRPHLRNIQPAVLTVGGWFDGEDLFGALACAKTLEVQSPATVSHLVMGPWTHGQWAHGEGTGIGQADFGSKTSTWFQEEIEIRFFNQHLLGETTPPLPKATVFETGRNQWRSFTTWPPREGKPKAFYLQAQGQITTTPTGRGAGFEAFISDPARPVPYTQAVSFGYAASYVTEDQRFAASRPDVLVYQTGPLEADLTLAGPLRPVLHVSTTGTDSDWIVKVIDVYPDDAPDPKTAPQGWHAAGSQMLVRGDVLRGKFRNSYSAPAPFVPGKPTEVAFTLPDICHTFLKGHRLMVQIQSTWFPLVDRNPQTFCEIPEAKSEAFRKAEHRVYHAKARPSRLEVLVLE